MIWKLLGNMPDSVTLDIDGDKYANVKGMKGSFDKSEITFNFVERNISLDVADLDTSSSDSALISALQAIGLLP